MRICIVAEHASTRLGGEAILPVHYFRLLRARGIDCRLIVHERTSQELTELFPHDLGRILFVRDLWVQNLFFSLSRHLPRRIFEGTFGLLNQLITQSRQRAILRHVIRDHHIQVIHQPIPVAPRFPSMLFGLGVPVLIGPLNGGMEYPEAFRRTESAASRLGIRIARLFVNAANTLLPGKRHAAMILVANERTRRALPSGIRGQVVELVENGIDASLWRASSEQDQNPPPPASPAQSRFVFLGRFIDWKAADIVIRALVLVPEAELELIGDGPMAAEWKRLAVELGVAGRVLFSGWVPQPQCPARLQNALALVLPSVYECGGAVVLEAMAMARPVIATNWGAPADYLDRTCGFLVDAASYSAMIEGFAAAMQRLIDSPQLARSMGQAARARALASFDWQHKIDRVLAIYRQLAGN